MAKNKYKKEYEGSNSVNLINFEEYLNFLKKGFLYERDDGVRCLGNISFFVLSNNVEILKELYGKQNFCWINSNGFRDYCWKIQKENNILYIFSGKRGTSFEVNNEKFKLLDIKGIFEKIISFKLEKVNRKFIEFNK